MLAVKASLKLEKPGGNLLILSSTPCRWQIVPGSSRKNASSARSSGGGGALYIPDPFLSTKADKRLFVTIVKPSFLAGPTIVSLKVERLFEKEHFLLSLPLLSYSFFIWWCVHLIISSNLCKSTLPGQHHFHNHAVGQKGSPS